MALRPSMAMLAVVLLLVSVSTPQTQAKSTGLVLSYPFVYARAQYYADASVSCLKNEQVDCSIDSPENATVSHELYRSKLGCCSGYKHHYIGASDNIVGRCEYTVTYHYNFIEGDGEYPTVSGGFYGTCYLNSPAEECVEPFCEDMVLSVQGQIYYLEDVVTDDPSENLLYKCFRDSDGGSASSGERATSRRKRHHINGKVTQVAGYQTASIASDSSERQLYLADDADVMSGPMTVFCHKSGQKWSGWFETPIYIDTEDVTAISHAEAADKTFVRPNDILLKIYKDSGYEKSA